LQKLGLEPIVIEKSLNPKFKGVMAI
jgi:hypothetical protein